MTPEDRVVMRLTTMFGQPRTEDPEVYVVEFAKAIRGYDSEALEKACDEVIQSSTFWPKPVEIIQRAAQIASWRARLNAKPPASDPLPPARSEDEKARVRAMVAEFNRSIARMTAPMEAAKLPDSVSRGDFEHMQRTSPNAALHRTAHGLSELSKRITGERDEG